MRWLNAPVVALVVLLAITGFSIWKGITDPLPAPRAVADREREERLENKKTMSILWDVMREENKALREENMALKEHVRILQEKLARDLDRRAPMKFDAPEQIAK